MRNYQRFSFFFLVLVITVRAQAGDGEYAVSKIPAELLKNADAVLRFEEQRFELVSLTEAVETYHYVITILNENGDDWADYVDYYDKLRSLSNVEGYLYDASGKLIRKMKPKDLEDLSGTDGGSLADDNRLKHHNFYCKVYPYTIEYSQEVRYKHSMFFPNWFPQPTEKISVEHSEITMVCPADYQIRYKAFNYTAKPAEEQEKNKKRYTWQVNNIPAILREPLGPKLFEMAPMVIFGPSDFQMGDYKGNMNSWLNFGKFQFELNRGRDELPPTIKAKVHELVDAVADPYEKIRVLYEYLQKSTRYISIQLGIGGWQSFDANYVASKGYGDCKALSNYMHSLLREAGIRSCYTLIRAGDNERYITSDFPSTQFNHVILSVPMEKDTLWLECTSQILAPGYLGEFTCDRDALMITEKGGYLVHTPVYGMIQNTCNKKIMAELDNDGALTIHSSARYGGLQQDFRQGMINYLSKEKVKEHLQRDLDFATYDIESFKYNELKSRDPEIDEDLNIAVSNYATITGKRLFITPNLMTRHRTRLKKDDDRKYPVVLQNEYRYQDTVEIRLPAGYAIESKPSDESIESKFGKYKSSLKLEANKLVYYREMEYYRGRFEPSQYNELVTFYDDVYKADRKRIVFVKDPNAPAASEPAKKAF